MTESDQNLIDNCSILLLVNNEGSRLQPTLDSCRGFAPIIAVTSDSLDEETKQALKNAQATIVQNKFVDFSSQRNVGLAKVLTDWVFVLDADEQIDDNLKGEIVKKISKPDNLSGYRVPRHNLVFGKILKYGDWYPDYQDRLFLVKKARYESPVHERVVLQGEWGSLSHSLFHDNYHSISHYIEKSNRYTDLEAKVLRQFGKKFSFYYLFGASARHFFFHYIQKKGYKDGRHGLVVAWLAMFYKSIAILKLWEMTKDK